MTDNKKDQQQDKVVADAAPESTAPAAQATETVQPEQTAPADVSAAPRAQQQKSPSSGKGLAIVAIILAIVLAAILYWHGHQQSVAQADQLEAMESRLAEQQSTLTALKSEQSATLSKLESAQNSVTEQVEGLSRKVLDLDSKRPNDWMLAEAEYLVRMAGRKLWLEHDAVSAAMMLANADERLAALNDPTLVPIRKALADDIASIKSVKKVDREGLVIKLNSINDQVDKLKLAGVIMARAEEPDFTVSESVSDWKENLKKSWASFTDDFVTVRRRDGNVEALLSPQQHWYLSENLKGKLLQAQLAVYREQQEIFDSSLAQSKQWLQDYFADDSVRQFMLEQINQLEGQQISVDYPEQFAAQERLQQLLDDRLQRLLTGL
ncbi:uroporphyrinogen-III C-methyltransferase [Oceanimonas marisflavi]|uniref:uroporphyrinogen-III C-methyltransferase n=1 Tax=Oceanimonas marisflavi TaxID=2059724 RepID=UPI000D31A171|nr:uroporphyrinogen-III C-methyltransferase [Oceanimonas marisflavi]